MSSEIVTLSRKNYDALKTSQLMVEEILSEKRKPVGYIYSGHINCSNDVIYQTDNQLTQTVITANKVMALKMSKHDILKDVVTIEAPISSTAVAAVAFIAGVLLTILICSII